LHGRGRIQRDAGDVRYRNPQIALRALLRKEPVPAEQALFIA